MQCDLDSLRLIKREKKNILRGGRRWTSSAVDVIADRAWVEFPESLEKFISRLNFSFRRQKQFKRPRAEKKYIRCG